MIVESILAILCLDNFAAHDVGVCSLGRGSFLVGGESRIKLGDSLPMEVTWQP